MQVIAGNLKGVKLFTPLDNTTRPTLSRVKEAFFNIIQASISNSTFLDIFSGTGQIGIEAISRGVHYCAFVDNTTHNLIQKNIKKVKLCEQTNSTYNVFSEDFINLAPKLQDKKFDYIYMDPPHSYDNISAIFSLIRNYNMLNNTGQIILEESNKKDIINVKNFIVDNTRVYGKTRLVFFSKEGL